jgi:hypothetical protein
MIITINLPPATFDLLQAEAQAKGTDVETVVREAVEAKMALSHVSIFEALKPVNDAIAESGMTPEEAEAFFEEELMAVRAERRSSTGKKCVLLTTLIPSTARLALAGSRCGKHRASAKRVPECC